MIKAIETKYKGYRFRSRLEARWAVFFDALGIKWEYEKEGYELDDGSYYLPDFWLPDVGLRNFDKGGSWIEIKATVEEIEKHTERMEAFGLDLVAFAGLPPGEDESYTPSGYQISPGWDNYMIFCICPKCKRVSIQYIEYAYHEKCNIGAFTTADGSLVGNNPLNDHINKAIEAARSARFEHGETP
jgi:hypothetical protein